MRRCLDLLRAAQILLRTAQILVVCGLGTAIASSPARATPALTMDVASGEVLYQQDATEPWFPASTTKLMTVYVALTAVREHKIAMDTPLVYSARARSMPPSKMGFQVGTQVTLENALRMLMVKSANDIAVTVAEGVSGSVEAFADDMNTTAGRLGLRESHFVNPNGLPNPRHFSSARDMALIARALYRDFPEERSLFDIYALSFGSQIIPNHNNLLGRYPDVDGMKTGFTCAAGFNVVASAYRDGRRVVVVVMGAPNVATRTAKVAALLDRAFANVDRPIGSVLSLPSVGGGPPDMHNEVCRARGHLIAQFNGEVEQLDAALAPSSGGFGLSALNPERGFLFNTPSVVAGAPMATRINSMPRPPLDPVPVRIGADPGYQGVVAEARAPHSPIGTETSPSSVEAYAATPEAGPVEGVTPLRADPKALPMRGRGARVAHRHAVRAQAPTAAAEAPKTKVIATAEGDAVHPKEAAKKMVAKRESKKAVGKKATAGAADGTEGAEKGDKEKAVKKSRRREENAGSCREGWRQSPDEEGGRRGRRVIRMMLSHA